MSKANYDKVMNIDPKAFSKSIVSDLERQAKLDAERIKNELGTQTKSKKKKPLSPFSLH